MISVAVRRLYCHSTTDTIIIIIVVVIITIIREAGLGRSRGCAVCVASRGTHQQ